jgi:hypothetical protein
VHPLKFLARKLSKGDPAATIDRLFKSKHVGDLRVIVAATAVIVAVVAVVGLVVSIEAQIVEHWNAAKPHYPFWSWVRIVLAALGGLLTFLAPALAGFGAICAWAYRAGSARLGVVDLFASEISTLCRVATIFDSVHRLTHRIEKQAAGSGSATAAGAAAQRPFVSQEEYFPVFTSNISALEDLEARVVIHITAFYTYMKALRDSMRTLAGISPETQHPESSADHLENPAWLLAARDVVYLWFLGLESARHAIRDLVEFEPEQAERVIVVLISELEAYRFLCGEFADPDDVRYGRIRMRSQDYRKLVHPLIALVLKKREAEQRAENQGDDWLPAWILLPELQRRYRATLSEQEAAAEPSLFMKDRSSRSATVPQGAPTH